MSLEIFLDNYTNICSPGQTISGRIECTFNREKNLRAIRVKFRGRAKTAWTESESYFDSMSKSTKTKSVHYFAEEVYMDGGYNLVEGGENFSLPAGRHVYPFSYILPPQLPSSFEGSVGNICYYVKAIVDRPWKFDYQARIAFNVASIVDLNFIPHIMEPVTVSDDKIMCSCWCKDSGVLTFNISLLMSGYVPGQEINIGCYVQNMTNVSVESVQFKVVATTKYITMQPERNSKSSSSEIGECVERGIGAHGEKSWISTLRIATNQEYPNLKPCSIIKLYYTLEAKIVLPFPQSDMKLQIPITIGSVASSGVNTTISCPPSPYVPLDLPNNSTSVRNSDLPGYPGAPGAPIKELLCLPSSEAASAPPPSYEDSKTEEKK